MFGMTKDVVLRSSITTFIPNILRKKHQRSVALTLNDASFTEMKKDIFLLGLHSSGYLIPLRASVVREISFSDIAQFYTKFVELPYNTPTMYLLVNKNGTIEGGSSGMRFHF